MDGKAWKLDPSSCFLSSAMLRSFYFQFALSFFFSLLATFERSQPSDSNSFLLGRVSDVEGGFLIKTSQLIEENCEYFTLWLNLLHQTLSLPRIGLGVWILQFYLPRSPSVKVFSLVLALYTLVWVSSSRLEWSWVLQKQWGMRPELTFDGVTLLMISKKGL